MPDLPMTPPGRAAAPRREKAGLLAQILGPERLDALRDAGLDGDLSEGGQDPGPAAPETLAWHRNRLIQKFRDRGLIDGPAGGHPAPLAAAAPGPAPKPGPDRRVPPGSGIAGRLAVHLDEGRLADEHPAVIALLLRPQPAGLRARVLRDLPGPQARAVARLLRAG